MEFNSGFKGLKDTTYKMKYHDSYRNNSPRGYFDINKNHSYAASELL